MREVREHWGSRIGFLGAAIGSAVGLGNMWRFSYLAAEHGGAAFVLFYLAFTLLIGLPVLLAELGLGRSAASSPVPALIRSGGLRWAALGGLFVATGFLILSYYSVIGGWTLRYAVDSLTRGFSGDPGARFDAISQGLDTVAWHALFLWITSWIVARGIRRGIERATLIMMPLLFVLVCGLAIYAATLEGAGAGYRFYLAVNLHDLFSLRALEDAAGQAFFSLSLGMGAMLTYASYLSRSAHLPREALVIALSDFTVAFIAGLMVFPLIFALGLQSHVSQSAIGALFVTLPTAFASLGTTGRLLGGLFFAALFFGALTSAISLLEVVVSSAIDVMGWRRRTAAWSLGAAIFALGVPSALDIRILDWMDRLAGSLFLVFGGLMLSLLVGWRVRDPFRLVRPGAEGVGWFGLWVWLLRIPVPLTLGYVLVRSLTRLGSP